MFTPLVPTGGVTTRQVLCHPKCLLKGSHDLCLFFPQLLGEPNCGRRHTRGEKCVCVLRSGRCLLLVCFELFHASCFDLPLSSLHPTRSLSLRLLVCSTPTRWGCGGGDNSLSQRSCLSCQCRERAVHWPRLLHNVGGRGSPRAKLLHSVQSSAPLRSPISGTESCVKNNCHGAQKMAS